MVFGVNFDGKFITRQLSFVSAGIIDKISSRFTGQKISFGKMCALKLLNCEPWTDHLPAIALDQIKNALLDHDFKQARLLLAFAFSGDEKNSAFCIKLLENVIELLAMGAEIDVELFPFME